MTDKNFIVALLILLSMLNEKVSIERRWIVWIKQGARKGKVEFDDKLNEILVDKK